MAAISAALTAASIGGGLLASAIGGAKSYSGAKEQAQASANVAGLEIQQDALRRQAMELTATRQSKEILRNQQRARAMALNATVNQGGQTGNSTSALGGAFGQISGQTNVNELGLSQNLSLGRSMFDLNAQINQQKMMMAQAGSQIALGQGISSFGSSLMGASTAIGNLGGQFGGKQGGQLSFTDFGTGQGLWPMYK